MARVDAFLKLGREQGCTDVHLAVGLPPLLRNLGDLTPIKYRDLTEEELSKGIIGTIGEIDDHKLPDAKGYTSMVRYITRETDEDRQQMRNEVLQTTAGDFKAFADALEDLKHNGLVKVLGSEAAIQQAIEERPGWLDVSRNM